MSLPRYPEYKAAGVACLAEVPAHWGTNNIKYLASRISSGKTPLGGSETYVGSGVTFLRSQNVYDEGLRLEDVVFISQEVDESMAVSRVESGDILLNITGASIGRSCLVPDEIRSANVNQHVCVIRLRNALQVPFVGWAFKSETIKNQIDLAQNGAAREGLNFDQIGRMAIPMPPAPEQAVIATFLDRETGKIDALIAEQEKLLALLTEKRQATISHAVTRGLNPDAPMKDSGVPWLGEVPAHWAVVPLMHLTEASRPIMYGIVLPGPDVGDGIPIVKGGDVKLHKLKVNLLNRTTAEIEAPFARARLRPKDVVYSIRGTIGDAEVVPDDLLDANITQDVARISPRSDIQTDWLLFAMKSKPVFVQLEQRSLGAAVRGINIFELKRARVPVPPSTERVAVAEFLKLEIGKLDGLRQSAERAITLLKERRSALIAAVVTGKIDVRDRTIGQPA